MIRSQPVRVGRSGDKRVLIPARPRHTETASAYKGRAETAAVQAPGGGGGFGAATPTGGRQTQIKVGGVDMTTPYVDDIPHTLRCAMYKDIYLHDNIAGPTVDLMSNIPFGDFRINVNAARDRDKIQNTFEETVEQLKFGTMLSPVGREVLTYGAFVSMLLYDAKKRAFTDSMPFSFSNCSVTPNILFGRDPIITVSMANNMKAFLANKSPTAIESLKRINPKLVEMLNGNSLELEPRSTMYVPRQGFASDSVGISLYSRILPIYFLEKVLYRGTVTLANRRQNSVTHIKAGDDEWEPTKSELDDLVANLIAADRDPIGAVIATNNRVDVANINSAGDFWKWNDVIDGLAGRKLTGMGVSEAFLSGDANYNNSEQAINGMLDLMASFRASVVRSVFSEKVFPLISAVNGYTWKEYGEDDGRDPTNNRLTAAAGSGSAALYESGIGSALRNANGLIIPEVRFSRDLNADSGPDPMEIMEKLAEKGIPFTFRAWAAAGGYDLDELLASAKNSAKDIKELSEIKAELERAGGAPKVEGEDGEPGEMDFNGEGMEEATVFGAMKDRMLKPVGLLGRDYTDRDYEMARVDGAGKRHYRFRQEKHQRAVAEIAYKAIQNIRVERNNQPKVYRPGTNPDGSDPKLYRGRENPVAAIEARINKRIKTLKGTSA